MAMRIEQQILAGTFELLGVLLLGVALRRWLGHGDLFAALALLYLAYRYRGWMQ